jgi:hypothetical protein
MQNSCCRLVYTGSARHANARKGICRSNGLQGRWVSNVVDGDRGGDVSYGAFSGAIGESSTRRARRQPDTRARGLEEQ